MLNQHKQREIPHSAKIQNYAYIIFYCFAWVGPCSDCQHNSPQEKHERDRVSNA